MMRHPTEPTATRIPLYLPLRVPDPRAAPEHEPDSYEPLVVIIGDDEQDESTDGVIVIDL